MSTPQGSGPNPPGSPAEQPDEQPTWGQPPPGGWGQEQTEVHQPSEDPDRTVRVDPSAWTQQIQPGQAQPAAQAPQAPASQPPTAQPPAAQSQPPMTAPQPVQPQQLPPPPVPGQPGWGPPSYPQQNPQQPYYGGQQEAYGAPPPYGAPQPGQQYGQQPPPWGQQPPAQAWGQPAPAWPGQQPPPWGQGPGQGGPAAYPPLPDGSQAKSGRSKLPLIIGGVVVLLAAAVLVIGFVTPGLFVTKVFDTAAVQTGVSGVLTKEFGLQKVTDVSCPANTKVKSGTSFTCDATVDGQKVKVPIKVTSDSGNYEVGRPT